MNMANPSSEGLNVAWGGRIAFLSPILDLYDMASCEKGLVGLLTDRLSR